MAASQNDRTNAELIAALDRHTAALDRHTAALGKPRLTRREHSIREMGRRLDEWREQQETERLAREAEQKRDEYWLSRCAS